MAEEKYADGTPWFWKIFGGAILGMIALLLLAIINNINGDIERTKNEFQTIVNELRVEVRQNRELLDGLKERVVALEQTTVKDKIASLEKGVEALSSTLGTKNEKVAGLEASITLTKEELKLLKDENKSLLAEIQSLKEKLAAMIPKEKAPE